MIHEDARRHTKVENRQGEKVLIFSVQDALQSVTTVEYGLNAGAWQLVYPVDGICDSKDELFEIKLGKVVQGTNTIVVKARDATGNIGFGKSNVEL